jgi:hypothetical protein
MPFKANDAGRHHILKQKRTVCEFARNTDPLRADFAFKSDPSDGCVSILPHGPEWPGRILGDGIGGPDRQGSARIF